MPEAIVETFIVFQSLLTEKQTLKSGAGHGKVVVHGLESHHGPCSHSAGCVLRVKSIPSPEDEAINELDTKE